MLLTRKKTADACIHGPTNYFNPLKPKLTYIIFKYSVHTSKKTQHFTITKMNWLMLFEEINAVYTGNHTKPSKTKCQLTYC
jgi:hypothetical protein